MLGCSKEAGSAAMAAEEIKRKKYSELAKDNHFIPIAPGVPENRLFLFQTARVFKFSRRFFFLFQNQIKWLIFFSAHFNTVKLQDQPLDLVVK